MDLFLLTVMFWSVVFWFLARLASDIYRGRLERATAELEEIEIRLPVMLTIDEINGMVYGWNHHTKDFVCQGRNLTEFRSHFRARYPNRSVWIMDGPEELITRFKTELGTLLQNELLNRQ